MNSEEANWVYIRWIYTDVLKYGCRAGYSDGTILLKKSELWPNGARYVLGPNNE